MGLLAAVALGALVATVLVVRSLLSDDPGSHRADPATELSQQPTAPPAPAVGCWDGSPAATAAECSLPSGEAGLRWVFPAMASQKCAAATAEGGPGLVTRILCLHRLEDGTRVGVGYFEWQSVAAGSDFYASQGLTASEVAGPDGKTVQLAFSGTSGDQTKAAALFVDAPFSFTITYPSTATISQADQQALAPRPADQLRGAPVG